MASLTGPIWGSGQAERYQKMVEAHQFDRPPKEQKHLNIPNKIALHLGKGEYCQALELALTLTKEVPGWSRGWIAKGDALWLQYRQSKNCSVLEESKQAYFKAGEICTDSDIFKGIGKTALAEGQTALALEYFKKAKEYLPSEDDGNPDETCPISDWIFICEEKLAQASTGEAKPGWIKA